MKMMRLRSMKKLTKSSSKAGVNNNNNNGGSCCNTAGGDIKWELRPGGMIVQKREDLLAGGRVVTRDGEGEGEEEGTITVRVSMTSATCHDIPIRPTSTFGELKRVVATVTAMEEMEQRLLFKGKEREDGEHLHMVGVRDKDKVLLLQDPAIMERKHLGNLRATIITV
ncbi:hypothetical protein MLD38_013236 [Melastoma candidum]|uniref:Uncharacterized protein n=1 Tax=Melastoma candidum TaxID=119954 RepID=A0ACB9RA21_9MYRT|nr:hypothetical protein MLD38_013236 [Melastoma candidum]